MRDNGSAEVLLTQEVSVAESSPAWNIICWPFGRFLATFRNVFWRVAVRNPVLLDSDYSSSSSSSQIIVWLFKISLRAASLFFLLSSAVLGLLWFFQEKLLFYPGVPHGYETPDKNPHPFQNPQQMNMTYKNLTLTAADGVTLHSWFITQIGDKKREAPTLLFLQGNAGNMGFRLPNIAGLYKTCGLNILALHYRGYAYSSGVPTEEGVYLDGQAALEALIKDSEIDPSKIFVFGRSLGGAVAINLAYNTTNSPVIRGLIVENTFTSLDEMVVTVFPFLRPLKRFVNMVQRLHMSSLDKVPSITTPTLFILGQKDELIPPSHMERLYSSIASTFKVLHKVPTGMHNDTWQQDGDRYLETIAKFIADVLKRSSDVALSTQKQIIGPMSGVGVVGDGSGGQLRRRQTGEEDNCENGENSEKW